MNAHTHTHTHTVFNSLISTFEPVFLYTLLKHIHTHTHTHALKVQLSKWPHNSYINCLVNHRDWCIVYHAN